VVRFNLSKSPIGTSTSLYYFIRDDRRVEGVKNSPPPHSKNRGTVGRTGTKNKLPDLQNVNVGTYWLLIINNLLFFTLLSYRHFFLNSPLETEDFSINRSGKFRGSLMVSYFYQNVTIFCRSYYDRPSKYSNAYILLYWYSITFGKYTFEN